MARRQSDPVIRKKGPSYFTFSAGDQAVGHSGFDKLLRWAEIDFPANPVYAEPQYLPQLRLPETISEDKLVEHMQRAHISTVDPMTAPIQHKHVRSHHLHRQHHHQRGRGAEASSATAVSTATLSPTSSQSRSRNHSTRKSLERQWIALAQHHISRAQTASSSTSNSPPSSTSSQGSTTK